MYCCMEGWLKHIAPPHDSMPQGSRGGGSCLLCYEYEHTHGCRVGY